MMVGLNEIQPAQRLRGKRRIFMLFLAAAFIAAFLFLLTIGGGIKIIHASGNANLTFTSTSGALNCSGGYSCTENVTSTAPTSSIDFTPTLVVSGGSITIDGTPWTSGTKYATTTTAGSTTVFQVDVTAADASTSTYQLTFSLNIPYVTGESDYGVGTISQTNILGLTTVGANAWATDQYENLFEITPSGTVTKYLYGGTDKTPSPFGLVTDGTNLWIVASAYPTSGIVEYTPSTNLWKTFDPPATGYADDKDGFYGATVDKYGDIWMMNWDDSNVVEVSPTGTYMGNFPTAKTDSYEETYNALTYDGTNVWAYSGDKYVTKLSPTGTILSTLNLGGGCYPAGATFDGTNIWLLDQCGTVTKISPSGTVLASMTTPIYSYGGITFDGTNIWAMGSGYAVMITPSGVESEYRLGQSAKAVAYSNNTSMLWASGNGATTFTSNQAGTPSTYSVTVAQGANGTISPGTQTSITSGSSETFTITPNSGYEINSLTIDGLSTAATSSYTFSNITADHTITATFSLVPVTLAISPATLSNDTVNKNFSQIFIASGTASGTFTWSIASGSLPSGVAIDTSSTAATTTLAGIPTGSGTFNFTIQVVNGSSSGTQAFSWTIDPAPASNGGGLSPVVSVPSGGGEYISPPPPLLAPTSAITLAPSVTTNIVSSSISTSIPPVVTPTIPSIPSLPTSIKSKSDAYVFVVANVVNEHGGTDTPINFRVFIKGSSVSPSSFNGSATGTLVALRPGTYSVSVRNVAGYSIALSAGCSGTAVGFTIQTCSVIATQLNPPQLTIIENVVNSYFGTSTAADFTVTIHGNTPSLLSFAGNASGTLVTMKPGSYSVSEKAVNGYTITLGSGCSGSVTYSSDPACTIIASDPTISRLRVTENVLNNYNGEKTASDFRILIKGKNPSPSFFAGNASGTLVTMNPGNYSVTQRAVTGYSITLDSGCSGSVVAGEVVQCNIITADLAMPKIMVFENVVNSYFGTSTAADFTVTIHGNTPSLLSFAGNASGTLVTMKPGSYSVSEKAVNGYTITLGSGCSGSVTYSSDPACTIIATQLMPKGYVPPAPVSNPTSTTTSTAPTVISTSTATSSVVIPPILISTPISTSGLTASTTSVGSSNTTATALVPSSTINIMIGDGSVVVTSTQTTITLSPLPPGIIQTTNESGQGASGWVSVPGGPYPWNLTPGQGIKTVTVDYAPAGSTTPIASGSRSVYLDLGQSILAEPMLDCNSVYLTGYAFAHQPTDPATVIKIQQFLNKFMGDDLTVNGVYDTPTLTAVSQFQLEYSKEILAPWVPYGLPNATTPTANTYKTTQRWINILACPGLNLPVPRLP